MHLYQFKPLPPLAGLVQKLWVFEASGPVPSDDLKLVVPNGLIKLVIPYRNQLRGSMEGFSHTSPEHQVTLIGICDKPSIVEAATPGPSGTIGIEFSAAGAYRFFQVNQQEIANRIDPLDDVLGKTARQLQEQLANTVSIKDKIAQVQAFLCRLLERSAPDPILDYCVQRIQTSRSRVTIKQLETETGYSSRWLNHKFGQLVGCSARNLISIGRFQQFYQAWATGQQQQFLQGEIDLFYYDQSHFIKDFKRFTGLTPGRFHLAQNDFGRIFYQEEAPA